MNIDKTLLASNDHENYIGFWSIVYIAIND